jgi:ribosomal protein S16
VYKSKIIRLRKKGAIYKPIFDIVVINRKLKSNSQKFDKIGFLIPFGEKFFAINSFKLANWLNYGVYLNSTVRLKLAKIAVKVAVPITVALKPKKIVKVYKFLFKSKRKYSFLSEVLLNKFRLKKNTWILVMSKFYQKMENVSLEFLVLWLKDLDKIRLTMDEFIKYRVLSYKYKKEENEEQSEEEWNEEF